jgi:hypothetical protein
MYGTAVTFHFTSIPLTRSFVEAFANQTVHFDLNPFVTDLSPPTADPNKQPSTPFTLKGFHLDKIAKVQLFEGTYKPRQTSLLQYDLESGGQLLKLYSQSRLPMMT